MSNRNRIIAGILVGLLLLFGGLITIANYSGHRQHGAENKTEKADKPKMAEAAITKREKQDNEESKPEERIYQATLAAAGDILIHDRVYNKAKTNDGYNFKPNLLNVKPLIQNADVAVANSESIIGGEDIGLSTYPGFNSPYEVGAALKDAGFDVVTMANNHTLDRGVPAITNAIHYWDKIGMLHTGSALSIPDQQKIATISRNHIVFSFMAYTYGTNGIPTPEGKDYLVNRINLPQIKADIKRAKKVSDVVVVALHFGKEYERMPNAEQKKLVKQLADAGADVILGSHPHVLQPVEWVQGQDGHKTFVAYSLGNFLSGQDDGIYKEIGGLLKLNVIKHVSGDNTSVVIQDPAFILTWVNPHGYKVMQMSSVKPAVLPDVKRYYRRNDQAHEALDAGIESFIKYRFGQLHSGAAFRIDVRKKCLQHQAPRFRTVILGGT